MDKLTNIEACIANIEQYLVKLDKYVDGLSTACTSMARALERLDPDKIIAAVVAKMQQDEEEEEDWWK